MGPASVIGDDDRGVCLGQCFLISSDASNFTRSRPVGDVRRARATGDTRRPLATMSALAGRKFIAGVIGNGKCGTKSTNLNKCAVSVGNINGRDTASANITFVLKK